MKNKINIFLASLLAFFIKAETVLAVEIKNPAPDFLIQYKENTFAGLLTFVIQTALGLVGVVAVLFIIIGGFQYITARGDEEQAAAGKKTLTNAIIGLVIVILSYLIVVVTINALNKTS